MLKFRPCLLNLTRQKSFCFLPRVNLETCLRWVVLANVSSPSSHLRYSKGFCLCRLLPNQPVKFIGIEYPKKVLLQQLQWQIVGASCTELSRLHYHIDGIPCPTSGIGSTKDGFRVYLSAPLLNHRFSLLVGHIA